MSIAYRPEIDGLRAIAVLGVVLYHARLSIGGVAPFVGGFVGVDVFFVISGYLITLIILREIEAGSFSFLGFYERRARRILPALFLMMAVTAPFALLLMEPQRLREYAGSSLSSLAFVSNLWFLREDSYTAAPSALKPLLHTWSLSVEEQFYLLYPVLLVALGAWRRHIVLLFLVAFAASLLLAQYGSRHFPDAAFFALPTRAWELLGGALLAVAALRRTEGPGGQPWRAWLVGLGLASIVAAFLLFDDNMRHPSLLTLLPVAGTMLVIHYGSASGRLGKLLASKPLVAIGLLSYSLYLWHYPVLALARVAQLPLGTGNTLLLLALAWVLALLSYRLVEQPARQARWLPGRRLAGSLGGVALLLAGGFSAFHLHSTNALQSFRIHDRVFDIDAEKAKRFVRLNANCSIRDDGDCSRPLPGQGNILVIGDSMAVDVMNLFGPSYPQLHFAFSSLGGCPPSPDIAALVGPDHPDLEACLSLNQERFTAASLEGFDGVIIHHLLGWFTAQNLQPYLDFLAREGMRNVLVLGTYLQLASDFPVLIQQRGARNLSHQALVSANDIVDQEGGQATLPALLQAYGFEYLDLHSLACEAGECRLFIGDHPFTWDRFHLSLEFAEFLGEALPGRLRGSWLQELALKPRRQAGNSRKVEGSREGS